MSILGGIVAGVSHPVWVRGLKQVALALIDAIQSSHPVWVRGLKQRSRNNANDTDRIVAPRVGAWIETRM